MKEAQERANMPKGSTTILDSRRVETDYATLVPLLTKGLRILDIGCGTGAISKGIADLVGEDGYVMGIDRSDHLVRSGKEQHKDVRGKT